ncbi:hypothetical protein BH11PLA2_BH11PLA2_43960 [soil metagenome]
MAEAYEERKVRSARGQAEYAALTTYGGSSFYGWMKKPGDPDNHFLDVTVLNALAASISGLKMAMDPVNPQPDHPKRKKLNIEELYARANGGAA